MDLAICKHKGTTIELWFVPPLVASGNFSSPVKILTRQLQPVVISCSNPAFCAKLPIVHIATQDSLFGQIPGNSVISVRPEMIVGSGWMVEFFSFYLWGGGRAGTSWKKNHLDGGLQLSLSGRGSVSSPFCLEALFHWPVSPDISDNWRKKCSYKNSLWSRWWELGKTHDTHSCIALQDDIRTVL